MHNKATSKTTSKFIDNLHKYTNVTINASETQLAGIKAKDVEYIKKMVQHCNEGYIKKANVNGIEIICNSKYEYVNKFYKDTNAFYKSATQRDNYCSKFGYYMNTEQIVLQRQKVFVPTTKQIVQIEKYALNCIHYLLDFARKHGGIPTDNYSNWHTEKQLQENPIVFTPEYRFIHKRFEKIRYQLYDYIHEEYIQIVKKEHDFEKAEEFKNKAITIYKLDKKRYEAKFTKSKITKEQRERYLYKLQRNLDGSSEYEHDVEYWAIKSHNNRKKLANRQYNNIQKVPIENIQYNLITQETA